MSESRFRAEAPEYREAQAGEDGGTREVRLSELFAAGKDTLVIYSFMFPLLYAAWDPGQEPRHVDSIWPMWNLLDATPQGREGAPGFPSLHYGD